MRDDRLLEMRVFKAVVEEGSFTAASTLLGVSQSFVSQCVMNLEQRLGVKLIHRSTRASRLTDEGEMFLNSCRRILEEIEQAEVKVSSNEPSGILRVSAPLAFGMDLVVPQIPTFLDAYPKIDFHLTLTEAPVNLLEDNIDVAVRMGELQDSSLISRRLCSLKRVVVASPLYVAKYGAPKTPQDLAHHNCVVWQPPMEWLNQWPFVVDGQRQDIIVRGNFRANNGTSLFRMCMAGLGIMWLAEYLAAPAIRAGHLVPLLSDYQASDETPIYAVFLPERKLIPRIRVFIDHFAATLRNAG